MDAYSYPVLLCEYLNGSGTGITFVPEVWREGAACVMLSGGEVAVREYVNGSAVISVPFEIRLRCSCASVKDRLDAVDFFSAVNAYVKNTPLDCEDYTDGVVRPVGGTFKSAVYESGEEEYRSAYTFRYLKKA